MIAFLLNVVLAAVCALAVGVILYEVGRFSLALWRELQ